jgi:hypothetical protein
MANRRTFKNNVIKPLSEFKLGAYGVGLLIVSTAVCVGYAFYSLQGTIASVLELADVPREVSQEVTAAAARISCWFAVIMFVFVAVSLAIIGSETRRVTGPAFALRRFVRDRLLKGEYDRALHLRKGDLFHDLSEALNELAERLKERSAKGGGSPPAPGEPPA